MLTFIISYSVNYCVNDVSFLFLVLLVLPSAGSC